MVQSVQPDRKIIFPILIALTLAAIALFLFLIVWLAGGQSLAEQQRAAASLSHQVLMRADTIRYEIVRSIDMIERQRPTTAPCSPDKVRLMGDVALTFSEIDSAGYVADDRLVCAAGSSIPPGLDVGPPSYVSSDGAIVRTAVRLPGGGSEPFLMISRKSGYTVMLHPHLNRSIERTDPRMAFGVVGLVGGRVIEVDGPFDRAWLDRFFRESRTSYTEAGRVIEIRRSRHNDYAAFAVLPMRNFSQTLRRYAAILLPAGLCVLILLAVLGRYVVRTEYSIRTILKNAIRAREFHMEYQPIVELTSGRWVGAEALLRWRRRTGELVRPDFFIGAAEENGLIGELTAMVFDLVAADVQGCLADDQDFYIAINVASADLNRDRLLALLERLAERTHLSPSHFVIEATERGLIDARDGRRTLDGIRDMECRVALDDFGTGYSSLSYLQTFRLDYIKIDKLFVDSIRTQAATSTVVSHIINMARDLDLQIVAEGVETTAQARFLRSSGVQFAQGWLYARPLRWSALLAELTARATLAQTHGDVVRLPNAS